MNIIHFIHKKCESNYSSKLTLADSLCRYLLATMQIRYSIILALILLSSCVQRPWIKEEIDCSWNSVQSKQRAIQVANLYLQKKGYSDFYQDSVRVFINRDDYHVFFKEKQTGFPGEIAVLVTRNGCVSFIPLK